MSSNKREIIKPNSKLGRIIYNYVEPDEYSTQLPGGGCEYVYGDPLDQHHYCGDMVVHDNFLCNRNLSCTTISPQ